MLVHERKKNKRIDLEGLENVLMFFKKDIWVFSMEGWLIMNSISY